MIENEGVLTPRAGSPLERSSGNPFFIDKLGDAAIPSCLDAVHWVSDGDFVQYRPFLSLDPKGVDGSTSSLFSPLVNSSPNSAAIDGANGSTPTNGYSTARPMYLERAGPRRRMFFDPKKTTAGIVTGGGLSPGLNNVIRALVNALHFRYGVKKVLGFRYGLQGLTPSTRFPPIVLTPDVLTNIHTMGGTFLARHITVNHSEKTLTRNEQGLIECRGPQDPRVMVDELVRLEVDILFVIGGDGSAKAAHKIAKEVAQRSKPISVVCIPKTIDNDIAFVDKTFGFETAVEKAQDSIRAAHEEARSAENGVGIVKLMGRDSGFIGLWASLASSDVNLLLIPEKPFDLQHVCGFLEDRLQSRGHCVIVVSEGAGQENLAQSNTTDLSGNAKMADVGRWLADAVTLHFKTKGMPCTVKYIDPSYMIRSAPANALDSVFSVQLAQAACHCAISGRTNCMVGLVHGEFIHIPIAKAIEARKKVDVSGSLYQCLLDNTGMPLSLI